MEHSNHLINFITINGITIKYHLHKKIYITVLLTINNKSRFIITIKDTSNSTKCITHTICFLILII